LRHPHHYDPNQPRVPKGRHGGGQWTDGKERELSKLRLKFADLDPSVRPPLPQIPSPPSQPQIPSPPLQPRTPSPHPQPGIPGRPPMPPVPRGGIIGLLSALAVWLAQRNSAGPSPVVAHEYELEPGGQFSPKPARALTEKEVEEICDRRDAVQNYVDAATTHVESDPSNSHLSRMQRGTKVHWLVETAIKARENPATFRAEESVVKLSEEEEEQETMLPPENRRTHKKTDYGTKGSIRVDSIEQGTNDTKGKGSNDDRRIDGYQKRPKDTVCVYDIKTGRRGLSMRRKKEIASKIAGSYPGTKRVVVCEIRPQGRKLPSYWPMR
jgi:hypothetical protein